MKTTIINFSILCVTPSMAKFAKSRVDEIVDLTGCGVVEETTREFNPHPLDTARYEVRERVEKSALDNLEAKLSANRDRAEQNMCSWAKTAYKQGTSSDDLLALIRTAIAEAQDEQ